ncbi:hypothetical protein HERIO_2551 [Hepatospora eriocheir]|uniref:Uncharacterized protein n=1 Tax=Hepatospora eriocheir TaxID=1081669 RepID=A0A1X0Q6J5_9MICR|nr:hypothetical protein HERIO_2551 [Hepatospora eriocheir]
MNFKSFNAKLHIPFNPAGDLYSQLYDYSKSRLFTYCDDIQGYILTIRIEELNQLSNILDNGNCLVETYINGESLSLKEGDVIKVENGVFLNFIKCVNVNNEVSSITGAVKVIKIKNFPEIVVEEIKQE